MSVVQGSVVLLAALFNNAAAFSRDISYFQQELPNQCDFTLTAKRFGKIPHGMKFFTKSISLLGERECVEKCYNSLLFCRSIVYIHRLRTCYYSYWADPACSYEIEDLPQNILSEVVVATCIGCREEPNSTSSPETGSSRVPAFVSADLPDLERMGLIWDKMAPGQGDSVKKRSPLHGVPLTLSPFFKSVFTKNDGYKKLMPKCKRELEYSMYAVAHTETFSYYGSWDVASIHDCASLCFQQHFCVTSLYDDHRCFTSHRRGVCSNFPLPQGYGGPVLISCIAC